MRISRNNLEKIITTKFLHVNNEEESDTKKVRIREGEEKGTVKVKRGIKGKKGQEGERKVKAEVGRN